MEDQPDRLISPKDHDHDLGQHCDKRASTSTSVDSKRGLPKDQVVMRLLGQVNLAEAIEVSASASRKISMLNYISNSRGKTHSWKPYLACQKVPFAILRY